MKTKLYSEQDWTPGWRYLASATLAVLSFPPWNLWPLSFICLIPWIDELFRERQKKRLILGSILFGFLATLMSSYWMAYFFVEFYHVPWNLSLILLELYSTVGNPQFPIFSCLCAWTIQRVYAHSDQPHFKREVLHVATAIVLSLFYTGIDWISIKPFQDTFGHALSNAETIRQFADIGGAPILTALIILINITLWLTLRQFLLNRKLPRLLIAFSSCVLGLVLIYGTFRIQHVRKMISEAPLKVQFAAIQGNISNHEKYQVELGEAGYQNHTLDKYLHLSKKALTLSPRPDFLAWPETSYPSYFHSPALPYQKSLDERLDTFLLKENVPLIFGSFDLQSNKVYSAMNLVQPHQEVQIYRKSIPTLFAEALPDFKYFQWIRSIFPEIGKISHGNGPTTLKLLLPKKHLPQTHLNIGAVICYEDLFPNYVAESARKGSQLILDAGNDNWFGHSGEPYNHLGFAVFRSIETRLPMLRVINAGVSALVLPDGSISEKTKVGEDAVLNVAVPINQPIPTLVKSWGNWFGPTSFILGLLGFLWIRLRELPRLE